jgi:hypothetical protein
VTSKAKNRHRKRHTRSPSEGKAASTGAFRMVVAANPGSSITVAPERDLVKAALLYGDHVTLLSPVTTMLLRAEGLQRFSPRQQIELLRRVAPILLPGDQVADFEQGMERVDEFLRATARGSTGGAQQLLRAGLLQRFQPTQRILSEAVQELAGQAGIDQLARARAKGLVQIENADPGDEMDLLVSCILSAKLAQTGQRQDEPHTNRLVETFVDKLSRHLASGREYLIFDEPIASLTEAAIREGLFTPASGPAGRSAQAMTASAFMGRLPTFPNATVDEVLDIRTTMASSLTQFRSAMVTISKTFTSPPWESAFEDELHDAWVETVHPAVEAIEASVRDNRSLLTLAAGIAGAANTAFPGLVIVAGGLLGHADPVAALGGALSGAAPVLQALRDRKTANNRIRMQPFYFLYGVEQSLS